MKLSNLYELNATTKRVIGKEGEHLGCVHTYLKIVMCRNQIIDEISNNGFDDEFLTLNVNGMVDDNGDFIVPNDEVEMLTLTFTLGKSGTFFIWINDIIHTNEGLLPNVKDAYTTELKYRTQKDNTLNHDEQMLKHLLNDMKEIQTAIKLFS